MVYVNNELVLQTAQMHDGDRLRIGQMSYSLFTALTTGCTQDRFCKRDSLQRLVASYETFKVDDDSGF